MLAKCLQRQLEVLSLLPNQLPLIILMLCSLTPSGFLFFGFIFIACLYVFVNSSYGNTLES